MRGIAHVARRELSLIAGHPALIWLTLILPLLLLAVLAAVFLRGIPTDLPFAVVDLDRTETSRSLSRTGSPCMRKASPSISMRSPGRGFATSATRRSIRVVSDQSRASPKSVTASARRATARTSTGVPPSAM